MRSLAALLLLAGCASAPTVADHSTACSQYRGTDAYTPCLEVLAMFPDPVSIEPAAPAVQWRPAVQNAGFALMQAGQAINAQVAAGAQRVQQSRAITPYTCRQTAYGVQCW